MKTIALVVLCFLVSVSAMPRVARAEALPQDHEYQRTLRNHLATLTEKDFAIEIKPFVAASGMSDDELFRDWFYTDYEYGGPHPNHLRLPASMFLLSTIEGAESVVTPPINAMKIAELAIWKSPINPYFNSRVLRNRAFVVAVIDMVMLDQLHEKQPGNVAFRSDYLGGTLIWLAYIDVLCADDMPAPVRAAYETGLRKAIDRIKTWGPRGTMTDMDLFSTVSLRYASQALNDPDVTAFAETYSRRLYTDARHFHSAGYFVDDHCFDSSYNGISLYFSSWSANASDWPFVKAAVDKAYRLRGFLCFPEPDRSGYYGPTHFNSRCSSDSFHDQWGWLSRHMGAALVTDHAMPFTRLPDRKELEATPTTLAAMLNRSLESKSDGKPQVWKSNLERIWTTVNFGAIYYKPGFYARMKKLHDEKSRVLRVPWDRPETFIENFENTLLVAKQAKFGVVIHTGAVSRDDPHWHRPVGFGGGAMSAFWTPDAGPVLLGRRRGIQGGTFDSYNDWRSWPTHAITGITSSGKVVSSARTRQPASKYDVRTRGATVRVEGAMEKTSAQGQPITPTEDPVGPRTANAPPEDAILTGDVRYTRGFTLDESGLAVESAVVGDGRDKFAELYEVIPVFLGENYAGRPDSAPTVDITYIINNQPAPATVEPVSGVTAIHIDRQQGGVDIVLAKPARVRLSPGTWVDGYLSSATCRNVMIDLLDGQERPDLPVNSRVFYRIVPGQRTPPASAIRVKSESQ